MNYFCIHLFFAKKQCDHKKKMQGVKGRMQSPAEHHELCKHFFCMPKSFRSSETLEGKVSSATSMSGAAAFIRPIGHAP